MAFLKLLHFSVFHLFTFCLFDFSTFAFLAFSLFNPFLFLTFRPFGLLYVQDRMLRGSRHCNVYRQCIHNAVWEKYGLCYVMHTLRFWPVLCMFDYQVAEIPQYNLKAVELVSIHLPMHNACSPSGFEKLRNEYLGPHFLLMRLFQIEIFGLI